MSFEMFDNISPKITLFYNTRKKHTCICLILVNNNFKTVQFNYLNTILIRKYLYLYTIL